MRGRIAIPIHDDQGRLVAYCGRTVEAGDPRCRFPAGFQKSQVLFNCHRARGAAGDQVIVVEGFFDCMRVHQAGFAGVVALDGGAPLGAPAKIVLLLPPGMQPDQMAADQIRRVLWEKDRSPGIGTNCPI